jgi:hypothetical protein
MDPNAPESVPGVPAGEEDHPSNGDVPPSGQVGRRLERLPTEVGALLMVVGIAGLLLPGPVGSPFVIAGGVALWPAAFGRVERWFQRRYPTAHCQGMEQIERYLDNLERRYPGSLK